MPNPYIKEINKQLNTPINTLEEKWLEAENLASKKFRTKNKQFYAYTVGIFKKLLGDKLKNYKPKSNKIKNPHIVYSYSILASSVVKSEWWNNKSREQQKSYLKKHPNSKYGKLFGIKNKENTNTHVTTQKKKPLLSRVKRQLIKFNIRYGNLALLSAILAGAYTLSTVDSNYEDYHNEAPVTWFIENLKKIPPQERTVVQQTMVNKYGSLSEPEMTALNRQALEHKI